MASPRQRPATPSSSTILKQSDPSGARLVAPSFCSTPVRPSVGKSSDMSKREPSRKSPPPLNAAVMASMAEETVPWPWPQVADLWILRSMSASETCAWEKITCQHRMTSDTVPSRGKPASQGFARARTRLYTRPTETGSHRSRGRATMTVRALLIDLAWLAWWGGRPFTNGCGAKAILRSSLLGRV